MMAVAYIVGAQPALACTAINVIAKDGSVVAGRSMEWAEDMEWTLTYVPGETAYSLGAPADLGLPEKPMTTQHAVVGIKPGVAEGDVLLEGTNAAGLTMSGNFLPGFTQYQKVTKDDTGYVSIYTFGLWSLGSFATVDELRQGISGVKVWWDGKKIAGASPDIHFVFTDESGDSLIVEFVDGEQRLYDNIVHTLTNAPTYDWHLSNLRNYLDLSATADTALNVGTADVTSLGQGGGLLGIPSDYTPPSRFVKSAYLQYFASKPKNATEATSVAGHLLNTVDIPHGVVRSQEGADTVIDYTQWVVLKDLSNKRMLIADYANRTNFLTLDLEAIFQQGEPIAIRVSDLPYPGGEAVPLSTAK